MSILKEKHKVFAWSYVYMSRLDSKLLVHNLGLKKDAKPIKQTLQKMHPTIALIMKEELQNILEVKFIQTIEYFYWISNMVPIKKPNGNIRVCIDFKYLNKACPKDDFPLLNIDNLVDAMAEHEMISLMDEFFGYNHIKVATKVQHKTTFTTP